MDPLPPEALLAPYPPGHQAVANTLRRLVKRAVQRFRRELLELAELDPNPRQVLQLNLQLFPLTRAEGE